MKIIDLEQGSPEWLRWRESKITATDASVIMGLNPFKDIETLWQEKLGMLPAKEVNEKMKRGQRLEPIARQFFIKEIGINVTPLCAEHDDLYWHASSLDGINEDRTILVEIKCTNMKQHVYTETGDIPKYYFAQIQHQLYTTGASICFYSSFHPGAKKKLILIEIKPDHNFIQEMIEKEKYFFEKNLCQMSPPEAMFL